MIRALIFVATVTAVPQALAVTLEKADCLYPIDVVPVDYSDTCYRMEWTEAGMDFSSPVAVFSPMEVEKDRPPVFYLPGGPGDAPIDEEAQPESVLRLFPGRTVILHNPRGVANTKPRPACAIPPEYWNDELDFERERAITTNCHDAVKAEGIPLHLFGPRHLAKDVSALARALKLKDAGIFGVSYGTETALHLISERPDWLRFAIVDSVSLPGVVGMADQLDARDAFLRLVDTLCFANLQCPEAIRKKYGGLVAWTRPFDEKPLEFTVGPYEQRWSYDSSDMLDFIAGLSTYPDGAAYAVEFIPILENDRESATNFIAAEAEANTEFGIANFTLLLETYSDGVSEADYAALEAPRAYPVDQAENREYLDLYRAWNADNRREAPFVSARSEPTSAGLPVLILSGGVDLATPLAWAQRLHRRFSGMTHYVFPSLGHATAFGKEGDVSDAETIQQMTCVPGIITAFLAGGDPPFPCGQYRTQHD